MKVCPKKLGGRCPPPPQSENWRGNRPPAPLFPRAWTASNSYHTAFFNATSETLSKGGQVFWDLCQVAREVSRRTFQASSWRDEVIFRRPTPPLTRRRAINLCWCLFHLPDFLARARLTWDPSKQHVSRRGRLLACSRASEHQGAAVKKPAPNFWLWPQLGRMKGVGFVGRQTFLRGVSLSVVQMDSIFAQEKHSFSNFDDSLITIFLSLRGFNIYFSIDLPAGVCLTVSFYKK